MKILTVVGARPNFIKAAPIVRAIDAHNRDLLRDRGAVSGFREALRHVLVHTGQHYDRLMSDSFFADLNLPAPDAYLGVGSGSHAAQTAEIMKKFEQVLLRERPDVVLVVGDVTSTLACGLVTAKIRFDSDDTRPLLAHVEAGLRSFDRTMPEEYNRVLTDHLSDILFVTEQSGVENLTREGISPNRIHFVGNTMIDSLLACKDKAEASQMLERLGLRGDTVHHGRHAGIRPYALLTLHRPGNVDNPRNFLEILRGLDELETRYPIIFPCHPRSEKRIAEFGLGRYFQTGTTADSPPKPEKGIYRIDPVGYLDFLCLMEYASIVLTDSGGIQEETTCLGVPCVTIRPNTERPVTVECGTNIIAGTHADGIRDAIRRQMERTGGGVPKNWDGQAATRIVEVLLRARDTRTSGETSLPAPSDGHETVAEVPTRVVAGDHEVRDPTRKLLAYCRANDWAGYDPYDGLNTKLLEALPFLNSRLPRLALIQGLKRSPINIRRLLFIPKTQNPKALALFLSALLQLSEVGLATEEDRVRMIDRLIALRAPGVSYWCWGYSFPWQTRTLLVPAGAPNLVCTSFAANALLDAYQRRHDRQCLNMAVSAAEYMLNELYWTGGDATAGFGYPLPSQRTPVHNANFLAAALLCRVYRHTGEEKFLDPALRVARYSVGRQHPDGSWDYGEAPTQRWIDNFHSGYNLCALQAICRYAQTTEFESSIRRGFEFYQAHFFRPDGAPRYFHDRDYPVDIHCVAQSIITLLALRDLDPDTIALARAVFRWAMRHMWDTRGFFYYRVLRAWTIRTSYMRWSQAWMLLAMSMLLRESYGEREPSPARNSIAQVGIC